MIGEWIGQFQLVEIVGQGGMSTVYKAIQPSIGRVVAVKVLPRQLSEDPTFLKRFRREVQVIARLEHRSIVPVYDYGEQDGVPYIVMRLMEPGTLRRRLFYEGIDLLTAVRIVEQVGEALDHAHSRGIIHRDLKPSNILLDENDNAYLTDFGIAKMLGSTSQVTGSGVVGTPSYMSPEQCQGKPTGPPSDIYALGAILFEMLTGAPPYEADTPLAVMYMHVRDPIPSAYQRNPNLPPGIDRVIQTALAKRPEARYPSAIALAADFRRVVEESMAGAIEPPHTAVRGPSASPDRIPPSDTEPAGVAVVEPAYEGYEGGEPYQTLEEGYTGGFSASAQPHNRASLMAIVGGAVLLAVTLGVAGLAIASVASSQTGNGGLFPTLPPTRTPGEALPTASPTSVIADVPSATPVTPGSLIEPTAIPTSTPTVPVVPTLAPTQTPGLPTAPPTATSPPTATLPPTVTPTATASPTPTSSPTFTATTEPPPGASGLVALVEGSGNNAEIVVIDANGGNRRRLTTNAYYDGEPDFSPDGSQIAFDSAPSGNRDIYIMSATGTNVRQVTSAPGDERHPDWSPNGQAIVYEAGSEDTAEIYVINADGTGNTRLTNNSNGDRAPIFSPDGTMIAFMTNRRDKWEIAIMAYPGGELIRIFDCPAPDCRFPTWAADGTYIAYNTLDSAGNVAEIWEVNVATGVSTALVSGTGNGRPCYARDGQHLYYNSTAGGNSDLYRINLITLQIVRLTTSPVNEYAPDWGPG